jgi:hypothetical protein
MSKTLVIVYSFTGTGRTLAQELCKQQAWPLGEVLELRPRAGDWGRIRCVLDSLLRRHPNVRYLGPPPRDFDLVVLIAPIWLRRLAGPMRSFVANYADSLPDIAVLTVMGSSDSPSAAAEIACLAERTPMLDATFTAPEIRGGACAARLHAFAEALRAKRRAASPVRTQATVSQAA